MKNFPHTPEHQALISVLKRLRKENGLTQKELAGLLIRPQSYVSKYENGERRLDFVDVHLICKAMGASLPYVYAQFEKALSKK